MKLTPLLALFAALFFFAGCGSSSDSADSSSSEAQAMGDEEVDVSTDNTADEGLLMDQYLSGEIPGYDEEDEDEE